MKVIIDKIKKSEHTNWNDLAHKFNQAQIDLFVGIDEFARKYTKLSEFMTTNEMWEVYKTHPFTKAIIDATVDQYSEFHHLL